MVNVRPREMSDDEVEVFHKRMLVAADAVIATAMDKLRREGVDARNSVLVVRHGGTRDLIDAQKEVAIGVSTWGRSEPNIAAAIGSQFARAIPRLVASCSRPLPPNAVCWCITIAYDMAIVCPLEQSSHRLSGGGSA